MENNLVCSVKIARVENSLRYFIRKFDPFGSLNVIRKEHPKYGSFSSHTTIKGYPFYMFDVSLAEEESISGTKRGENLAVLAFSKSSDLNNKLISEFGQNTGINFSDEIPDEIHNRAKNIYLPVIYDFFNKYS